MRSCRFVLPAVTALCLVACGNTTPPPANPGVAAERIVTLAPHLTELAYSAGAGDKLVGVVAYSDYPPARSNCRASATRSGSTTKPSSRWTRT